MPTKRPIRVLQLRPMMPSVNNPEVQLARLREHFGDDVEVVGSVASPDDFWTLLDLMNSNRADVVDGDLLTSVAEPLGKMGLRWIRPMFRTSDDTYGSAYRGEFVYYVHMISPMGFAMLQGRGVNLKRRRFPKQAPLPFRPSARGEVTKHTGVSVG